MRWWTHYWARATATDPSQHNEFDHSGSNQFRQRGIVAGDVVFAISFFDDELHLLGRMKVDAVVGMAEARARLSYEPWDAEDHVIGVPGNSTNIRPDLIVPDAAVASIEFVNADGAFGPPKRRRDGRFDPQTFRGVREISRSTASAFEGLLGNP